MTHRPPRRRRFLAVSTPALVSILALGLPFSVQVGPSLTSAEVSPVADETDLPERLAFAPEPVAEPVVQDVPTAGPAPDALFPDAPAPEPPEPPAQPAPAPDPCADALAWVAQAGLPLPDGIGYHCPSTQFSHHGAACFNGRPCRGTGFIAINLDLMPGASTEYLRHVVAHEVCHIFDFQATGRTTEASADACAAAHGAP